MYMSIVLSDLKMYISRLILATESSGFLLFNLLHTPLV